jgi:hypothetical protein
MGHSDILLVQIAEKELNRRPTRWHPTTIGNFGTSHCLEARASPIFSFVASMSTWRTYSSTVIGSVTEGVQIWGEH